MADSLLFLNLYQYWQGTITISTSTITPIVVITGKAIKQLSIPHPLTPQNYFTNE